MFQQKKPSQAQSPYGKLKKQLQESEDHRRSKDPQLTGKSTKFIGSRNNLLSFNKSKDSVVKIKNHTQVLKEKQVYGNGASTTKNLKSKRSV